MRKREMEFLTRIKRSFFENGMYFYKIPDSPPVGGGIRFQIKKPFDAFVLNLGMAIEAKQSENFEAIGMRHFEDGQIVGLDMASQLGNLCYVFINCHDKKERINKFVWIKWEEFKKICAECGSVKKKMLQSMDGIFLKSGKYDLTSFLESLE